jgi:hypothetical protein
VASQRNFGVPAQNLYLRRPCPRGSSIADLAKDAPLQDSPVQRRMVARASLPCAADIVEGLPSLLLAERIIYPRNV